MRQPLVAGNWKMNGSLDSIISLVEGIKAGMNSVTTAEMAVCPPYVYIPQVAALLEGSAISLGAQDVSDQEAGAYTGEVAPAMLTDVGCKYAIVGHSERRSLYGESDADTASKFAAARKAGLTPILCVGELLEEREQGITEDVVARQLDAVIDLEGIAAFADAVIAYEPVWAIGTGRTAGTDDISSMHNHIRDWLVARFDDAGHRVRILYGGSVKPDNAGGIFQVANVDGALVGGASLKATDFLAIARAALPG